MNNGSALAARLREVLKDTPARRPEHDRQCRQLVASLVQAVQTWEDEQGQTHRRSA